ncbi:MAG: hypothetical protein HYY52_07805 [Candidatus Melainabacteria bacterium]|nr:hypothetical protein [Candidatus Melainabacteria bacterium]
MATRVNPINNNSNLAVNLVHPGFNDFFKWMNGKFNPEEAKQKGYSNLFIKTNGLILNTTKSIWSLHLPLQIIGLFSERFQKLAKAFYGVCWSIVYTSLRPFTPDRKTLGGNKATPLVKEAYNLNEHFRVGMGTVVSALYGGGASGMLWGAITGDDNFFDKSAKVYSTGMFNQNQIFGSMNLEKLLSRKFNNSSEQLPAKVDQEQTGVKEKMEFLDAVLFIPNVIARGLDTVKLFGGELGEGLQRSINAFGKFSYGTWACRFGELKKKKSKEEDGSEYGGDLEPLNPDLEGAAAKVDKTLRATQEKSAKVFQIVIPGLSWTSSLLELVGLHELSEKVFKWEGILERLHPTIASWCIRHPILNLFKKVESNQQEIQKEVREDISIHEQHTATQVEEEEEPVILSFVEYAKNKRDEIERKNGESMKVDFNLVELAKTSGVNPDQLKEALKYEIEFQGGLQQSDPGIVRLIQENYPGDVIPEIADRADIKTEIKRTAEEIDVPDWIIYQALRMELLGQRTGWPADYRKLRERTSLAG